MISDVHLNLGDGTSKSAQIALGNGRQGLHDREPTKVAGELGREFPQPAERFGLIGTVDAPVLGIENEQEVPVLGKWQARDDRCGAVLLPPPAVESQAAMHEEASSKTGARGAVEQQ